MSKTLEKSIFIDALALIPERKSGIGSTLQQTLNQLIKIPGSRSYNIYLVVPLGKAKYLKSYARKNVKIKTIPLPARLLELLSRTRLLPPVDWYLGRGIYIFPNYRNWPLWYSRSITYVYDMGYLLHPETVQVKNQKYLSKYMSRWMRRTDQIITISSKVHDEIAKYLNVPYNKISIVYCGVNRKIFYKRSKTEIEAVKKRYEIPYEKYLLYIGNIEPRKNLINLVEAYLLLPDKLQNEYGLVFVGGDGWLNDKIKDKIELAKQQGKNVLKVNAYVASKDLPAIYSGSSLLIHPAIYEGFGITPLEAMACEVPVAISDIESIREVVQANGYYFDPSDTNSIKKAIIESLNEKQERKTSRLQRGLLRCSELSWYNSAQSLYSVVERLHIEGVHRKPLLRRIYGAYILLDGGFRKICGETILKPYVTPKVSSVEELKRAIYEDYLQEQPTFLQKITLKVYLKTRHTITIMIKKLLNIIGSIL